MHSHNTSHHSCITHASPIHHTLHHTMHHPFITLPNASYHASPIRHTASQHIIPVKHYIQQITLTHNALDASTSKSTGILYKCQPVLNNETHPCIMYWYIHIVATVYMFGERHMQSGFENTTHKMSVYMPRGVSHHSIRLDGLLSVLGLAIIWTKHDFPGMTHC